MDKTIHKHLDNKDDLLEKVKKDLEGVVSDLDIEAVLEDPESALQLFAEEAAMEMIAKYGAGFIEEGQRFAQDVLAKRAPIVVDKSEDLNANKEEFAK